MVMVRTALLAGASVIAAACVACTPKPQPPPPSVWSTEHRGHICTDEDSFIKSIHFVRRDYDPVKTNYADPPATDEPLPDVVVADLRSAYRMAPGFFQRDVCALDGVFVNPDDCDHRGPGNLCTFDSSWGFRSPYDPNKGKRYIAISLSNWPTVGHSARSADSRYGGRKPDRRPASRLSDYSTNQLNTLLKELSHLTLKAPPKFDSDDPANSSGMTVLAVLAHELGHVRWYDWVEPIPGTDHERSYDLTLLLNCVPKGFFEGSWRPYSAPPNRPFVAPDWLAFGEPVLPDTIEHAPGPTIEDFIHPGQRRDDESRSDADTYQRRRGGNQPLAALAASLDDLYGNDRPWASLLSFLSPTEDFVETYVLSVLTQASPQFRSLRLTIRGILGPDRRPVVRQDIVANPSGRPALERKVTCVSTLSQNYP
jgi:hypothetical protein